MGKIKKSFNKALLTKVAMYAACAAMCGLACVNPAFAAGSATATTKELLGSMIETIETIFQAVGIILLAVAVGQLLLAFKNDDPDSKSRATTLMVAAAFLILIKPVIDNLDLLSYLN